MNTKEKHKNQKPKKKFEGTNKIRDLSRTSKVLLNSLDIAIIV